MRRRAQQACSRLGEKEQAEQEARPGGDHLNPILGAGVVQLLAQLIEHRVTLTTQCQPSFCAIQLAHSGPVAFAVKIVRTKVLRESE